MTIIANKSIITKIKYKNKLTYIEPVNLYGCKIGKCICRAICEIQKK